MILLDGKALRDRILADIASALENEEEKPGLAVVQVGEDPASSVYIRNKIAACSKTGIRSRHLHLPDDCSQGELNRNLRELSQDSLVHGILLQLPLPTGLSDSEAMSALDPEKDVDGFHPHNLGRLLSSEEAPRPCTPAGIVELLRSEGIETRGKEVVILGRSLIVGKPAALLFLEKHSFGDATVTICHSRSKNLAEITRRADILVAAIGKAHFLDKEMVKKGAVILDVGINRMEDPRKKSGYRLVGDCNPEGMDGHVSAMTPVPGGVGPMTIAQLMRNTYEAWLRQTGRSRPHE
ncbi:MAG: bifunctional methylenetetrahydrofolate dehydrogenase/methenyltetrahydrofolate cyclohydrolase FolD [Candidatus Krumholzibacteria bacterium]|jgi:methylenetetrahydrofolate dehydrogenase (NADP+)/methenyltetrahydrofolate cyclohydrolase|nr:bifunctional methylenetetrahydrofolate dehydrogenase/methenyltetrahydrofolate cyclohydrolase FolD [Candidatus Krumholzibacteria bacterium]MDP6669168.1 bifunctional methylenetetrahydrofolate dehydrogenase/methenyltetrahydrofolate cyclohydrolase FolD [Candidatus Krumholzibacteria bacterium]MDP6797406.1 bifunctional methylenetetrahydrofolate dehydrogenase/methenyltetrahydrofolate cyclohydrolase FolD [Candidatus Krumholzibacteria bacterium]MDP7020864.1 bifunctional methylenetetrahydrofolate dehyd